MTRCEELNRWLDEGMPAEGAAAARAHAASCAACQEAMEAADSMERAFALPAPTLPHGLAFTARVMEQVRATAPLALPAAPEKPRVPWWIAILSEPGFAVALAAVLALLLTPAAIRLDTGRSVAVAATVATQTMATQVGSTLAGWFDAASVGERMSPQSRTVVVLGFAPLLVWAGLWMFGAVERLVRKSPARRG